MSQQNHLRDRILDAASAAGQRPFVPLPASSVPARGEYPEPTATPLVGTLLETGVEELRLERKGAGDASFALRIKARARLSRPATGEVISDQVFEYQSGQDLFLDWALNHGEPFQKCTDTGYRRLASQIVAHLFETAGEVPILVGAGAPKQSAHPAPPQARLAFHRPGPPPSPRVQFVSQAFDGPENLYVFPAAPDPFISVQKPLTKDEAVSEALSDVNRTLEGLGNHPNTYVSLTAMAAAIPFSLYKQTAAAITGVSSRKHRNADHQVAKAAGSSRPTPVLAREIAQALAPRCSESVVLLDRPREDGGQLASVRLATDRPMPVSWSPDGPTIRRAGDKALAIEVLSAALKGGGGANPSLAVHLEARATLLRADDGRQIYSCPVQYRGRARKFTAWAANDAKLLREELQRCYGEVSGAVIEQMIARRLITPSDQPSLLLAGNSK
jgi:hypothetical protein